MEAVNLLGAFGPELVGPILMVVGLAMSLGALAYLLWRRSAARRNARSDDTTPDLSAEAEGARPARRRALVSDPDRVPMPGADDDTPPAEAPDDGATVASAQEAHWEEEPVEAEFEEESPLPAPGLDEGGATGSQDSEEISPETVLLAQPATESPDDGEAPRTPPVEAARWRPIVFRQFRPQGPGEDGLSFYGGLPIGPADLVWPRGHGEADGPPLTFIMQWDCAQLAAQDPTGLLPKDGALYCFLNIDWGHHEDYTCGHVFIHHPGPSEGWEEIALPDDARPVFGAEGAWQMRYCSPAIDGVGEFIPRRLARFPFEPVAIDYPVPEPEGEHGEHLFWNDEQAAEALLALMRGDDDAPQAAAGIDRPLAFERPFATFPHDFGAIRLLAAAVIEALDPANPDLSGEEHAELFAQWNGEAQELYRLGCQRPLGHAVEQNIADDIWAWAEARKDQLIHHFDRLVVESVDLSLGTGSEALPSIPDELIVRAMRGHALASEQATDDGLRVHAPTPARMFGPPSYVQGHVEELVEDHLLLLELGSGSGPEHHFGEGVLQYLITPEDLAAGRFDRVKAVLSSY
jgi:hypothetical protein